MILEVVVAAFVLTQLGYAVVNCGVLALFLRRPTNVVDEWTLGRVLEAADDGRDAARADRASPRARVDGGRPIGSSTRSGREPTAPDGNPPSKAADDGTDPDPRCRLPAALRRPIHVFVPLVGHRWDALEATVESVAAQSYPTSLVTVTVVYEPRETDALELEGAVDADRPSGLTVETLAVDAASRSSDGPRSERSWWVTGVGSPPATAAMLTAAFESQSIAADDLVTVVEAGSWLPVDAFELAVAGLEEYDLVQTKQTVRDVDAGALPLLESMATAAWSDLAHGSGTGPYHLLETGYVTTAGVLEDVANARRETTADLPIGLAAARRGATLGVVDRYVRRDCPVGLEAWLARKRGWCQELYRRLFARGWDGLNDLRCWSGTLLLQALACLSVVGLPAAVLLALLPAGPASGTAPLALRMLVGFNGLVWAYYCVRAYRAAWDAVPFRSHPHRLAYSAISNPFSQILYGVLWAVPICLGLVDAVRGEESPLEQTET